MRRFRNEIDLRRFRPSAVRGISEVTGWVAIQGRRRLVRLVAEMAPWDGSSRKRGWSVTAYYTPPGKAESVKAEAEIKHGLRWEAAEMALQALQLELVNGERRVGMPDER